MLIILCFPAFAIRYLEKIEKLVNFHKFLQMAIDSYFFVCYNRANERV